MMPQTSPYQRQASFAAPAKARAELWRVAVVFVAFWTVFWGTPLLLPRLGIGDHWIEALALGATPGMLFLALASFGLPVMALILLLRRVHGRGFLSLLGPSRLIMPQFGQTLRYTALALLGLTLLHGFQPEFVAAYRPFLVWLLILPFALVAIFIQTSAEEVLFRGYLQQQLGARSSNPWVWMVIPSVLFALPHAFNTVTLPDALFYIGWTFLFGLIAADLTARSGSLGPALALHFTNNASQFLIFGYENGPMSGFALVLYEWDGLPIRYIYPEYPVYTAYVILLTLFTLLILWLVSRLALRR